MATVVTQKPSAPHQTKMKRPPLPSVQTNGIQSSNASNSPSTSTKRPPGFKQPPTPTVNGVNGEVAGLGPRLSNRRKESQKLGDNQIRLSRSGRGGQDGEKKPVKRMAEPYVKTQSYILKRYRNKPPSLIVHLHPTHFRFDTQEGSFSYNSPMKVILEHLKSQTVPHDLMEELNAAGTRFYEGCLIVQVQDHRSSAASPSATTNTSEDQSDVPGSIHNYNPYITPSPYVEYPKKVEPKTSKDAGNGSIERDTSSESKTKEPSKPNIFHVVLFPTPLSIHEEVVIQANTLDPRQNGRKQSTAIPRTPASATIPPTPSSAVPSTPSATGPPAKKQKMSISGNELHTFESRIIQTTAAPLFLDPVEDILDAQKVLENLTDPRHNEPYPAPKVKKRTVAELAADEAIAAQSRRYMLTMDDNRGPGSIGAKAGATDGESGISTFQGDFEPWQALRSIKADREEREIREREQKALRDATAQANKLRHEQLERAQKLEMERRAAHVAQEQQARQAQLQARELQRQQALANSQNQLAHGHGHPMPNGISRAQNSSPVVRNGTPNANSSPLNGHTMHVTSSGQGVTSSPARPTSAAQHGQPGGIGMTRQISRQQGPSRTGTPQMNGTPATQHATPVLGQSAMPRGTQGSPPMATSASMNNHALAQHHVNGHPQQFSPEQQQQQLEDRRLQAMYAQRQQQQQRQQMQQLAAQRVQNNSPNPQMSPEQRNPTNVHNLQQQATLNQQRTQQEYQQHLQMQQAAAAMQGHPNMPNGSPLPQQHPQQGHPQNRPGVQITPQQRQFFQAQAHHLNNNFLNQLAHQKYGGNIAAIPHAERLHCEQRAKAIASDQMKKQMGMSYQRKLEQQQQQQQQQLQQLAALNGMNGMNGQGMQGMHGMGVQGMPDHQKQMMMQGMQQLGQLPRMGGNGLQNVNGVMHNQQMNGGGMGGMT
ncbi:hypothetical protein ACLMJK_002488 [Lecanora helva]